MDSLACRTRTVELERRRGVLLGIGISRREMDRCLPLLVGRLRHPNGDGAAPLVRRNQSAHNQVSVPAASLP